MCKAAGFAAISHDLFFGKLRTPAGGGTDFCGNGNRPAAACETEEDEVIAGLTARGFGISVVPYMDLLKKLKLNILP